MSIPNFLSFSFSSSILSRPYIQTLPLYLFCFPRPPHVHLLNNQKKKKINESLFPVQISGLSKWVSSNMNGLSQLPTWAVTALLSTIIAAVTEITSNSATTTLFVPIVGQTVGSSRQQYDLDLAFDHNDISQNDFVLPWLDTWTTYWLMLKKKNTIFTSSLLFLSSGCVCVCCQYKTRLKTRMLLITGSYLSAGQGQWLKNENVADYGVLLVCWSGSVVKK